MLRKFVKIQGHNAFRDFTWDTDAGNSLQFVDRNLIFGWNGSGKTTLSRLFGFVRDRQKNAQVARYEGEVRVRVTGDKGDIKLEAAVIKLPQVLVFNTDYVRDVIAAREGKFAGAAWIGDSASPKSQRITRLEHMKLRASKSSVEIDNKKRRLDNDRKEAETDAARSIGQVLGLREGSSYTPRSFNAQGFRSKCAELRGRGVSPARLEDADFDRHRALVNDVKRSRLSSLPVLSPNDQDLANRFVELMQRRVENQTIDALRDDTDVAEWVRSGLHLHDARSLERCLFCDHALPKTRIDLLRKHFDAAYERLITDLRETERAIKERRTGLQHYLQAIPKDSEVSAAESTALREARCAGAAKIQTRLATLQTMLDSVIARNEAPLDAQAVPEPLVPDMSAELNALSGVLRRHNEVVDSQGAALQAAEEALFGHYWAIANATQAPMNQKIAELDKLKGKRVHLIEIAESEILRLRDDLKAKAQSARELTNALADYLGHKLLALEATDEGYQLTRSGHACAWSTLSEGEKSGIALLYFLHMLEKDHQSGKGCIVVVDDPVCSLDSNSLYSAIGHIVHRLGEAEQLFLLTHNLTAYREWKKGFKKNREDFRCMAREKDGQRTSVLTKLEDTLSTYNSEYQYLYQLVRLAAAEKVVGYDAVAIPNVIRRLAEAFIGFKCPEFTKEENPKLKESLERLFAQKLVESKLNEGELVALERFLNRNSHNNAIAVPAEAFDSPPAEVARIATILLSLMKAVDPLHVDGLERAMPTL